MQNILRTSFALLDSQARGFFFFFPPIRISFYLRGSPTLFAVKNWKYSAAFIMWAEVVKQKLIQHALESVHPFVFIEPIYNRARAFNIVRFSLEKNAGKMKHSYRLRSLLSPAKCFSEILIWFFSLHHLRTRWKIQQCTKSEEKKSTKLPQQDVFHFETWEPPYVR